MPIGFTLGWVVVFSLMTTLISEVVARERPRLKLVLSVILGAISGALVFNMCTRIPSTTTEFYVLGAVAMLVGAIAPVGMLLLGDAMAGPVEPREKAKRGFPKEKKKNS